jgi:hypothetical protein
MPKLKTAESTPAREARELYLRMGPERSIQKVAGELDKSAALIGRWSSRYGWQQLAADYDSDMAKAAKAAEERKLQATAGRWAERLIATREEAYQMAKQLIEKAEAMLKFPLAEQVTKDGKTVIKPGRWTFADAARMIDVANRLKQLATGLPTDRHEHSGPDGQPLAGGGPQVVFYIPSNERDEPPVKELP